jgi:cytochrome b involved in lipid metabolism
MAAKVNAPASPLTNKRQGAKSCQSPPAGSSESHSKSSSRKGNGLLSSARRPTAASTSAGCSGPDELDVDFENANSGVNPLASQEEHDGMEVSLIGKQDATVAPDAGSQSSLCQVPTRTDMCSLPLSPVHGMQKPSFTMEAVARHKSRADVWVVIKNRVYDVTQLLATHPGGFNAIFSCAGTDATEIFVSSHSADSSAHSGLDRFEVGWLSSSK